MAPLDARPLTAREEQVLHLVAQGGTNQAIGHALAVSPRTVAKHLEHVYRKLDVSCRAAAVDRASRRPGRALDDVDVRS